MATIKVKFRASSVPGKEGTLYYHLIHQRNLRWISTDYHVFPEEWNDKKSAIIVSNRNNRQAHLQLIQSQIDWEMKQMQRIIHDKEMDGIPYTIDDIAKEIQQLPPNKSVFTFFRQQIAKKEQMQCIGTKSNYVSAANRFMEFRNHTHPGHWRSFKGYQLRSEIARTGDGLRESIRASRYNPVRKNHP